MAESYNEWMDRELIANVRGMEQALDGENVMEKFGRVLPNGAEWFAVRDGWKYPFREYETAVDFLNRYYNEIDLANYERYSL